MAHQIRIGSRGSQLALWQTHWVQKAIEAQWPEISVEAVVIKTTGDRIQDVPLAKVGGKGLFVKEIEEALIVGRIDLAVHSMKDMPAQLPHGLGIHAVPQRETPLDALITRENIHLKDLPVGARIGTSSLRRASQLLHHRPDLCIVPLRGNLDTRLKKLSSGDLDAIVLAAAGLKRLGLDHHITTVLPPDTMLPAVGQGALCIEGRTNDPSTASLLTGLDHAETHFAVMAERAFLDRLQGGCQVPIAALGIIEGETLNLTGLVAELDGSRLIKASRTGPCDQAVPLGRDLAEALLLQGAGEILERLEANAAKIG